MLPEFLTHLTEFAAFTRHPLPLNFPSQLFYFIFYLVPAIFTCWGWCLKQNAIIQNNYCFTLFCIIWSLTLIPGNVMEQIILEAISTHLKVKKMIEISQYAFMKRKYLTNLIALMTMRWPDQWATGQQWRRDSGWCSLWLQYGFQWCLPQHPHREPDGVQARQVNGEMNWKLAELLDSESCDHWPVTRPDRG